MGDDFFDEMRIFDLSGHTISIAAARRRLVARQPRRLSLQTLVGREGARFDPEQIPRRDVIERRAQAAMIVVLDRHEAEGLQHTVGEASRRAQDFRHAVNRAGLRLEGDFDEVPLRERLRQAQQAPGGGNGLEFGFGAAAIF